jgi:hypothetical protein
MAAELKMKKDIGTFPKGTVARDFLPFFMNQHHMDP